MRWHPGFYPIWTPSVRLFNARYGAKFSTHDGRDPLYGDMRAYWAYIADYLESRL